MRLILLSLSLTIFPAIAFCTCPLYDPDSATEMYENTAYVYKESIDSFGTHVKRFHHQSIKDILPKSKREILYLVANPKSLFQTMATYTLTSLIDSSEYGNVVLLAPIVAGIAYDSYNTSFPEHSLDTFVDPLLEDAARLVKEMASFTFEKLENYRKSKESINHVDDDDDEFVDILEHDLTEIVDGENLKSMRQSLLLQYENYYRSLNEKMAFFQDLDRKGKYLTTLFMDWICNTMGIDSFFNEPVLMMNLKTLNCGGKKDGRSIEDLRECFQYAITLSINSYLTQEHKQSLVRLSEKLITHLFAILPSIKVKGVQSGDFENTFDNELLEEIGKFASEASLDIPVTPPQQIIQQSRDDERVSIQRWLHAFLKTTFKVENMCPLILVFIYPKKYENYCELLNSLPVYVSNIKELVSNVTRNVSSRIIENYHQNGEEKLYRIIKQEVEIYIKQAGMEMFLDSANLEKLDELSRTKVQYHVHKLENYLGNYNRFVLYYCYDIIALHYNLRDLVVYDNLKTSLLNILNLKDISDRIKLISRLIEANSKVEGVGTFFEQFLEHIENLFKNPGEIQKALENDPSFLNHKSCVSKVQMEADKLKGEDQKQKSEFLVDKILNVAQDVRGKIYSTWNRYGYSRFY